MRICILELFGVWRIRRMSRIVIRFTMIELLVVLSVIGVLLAVLTPALKKVKDLAHEKNCTNNLRQLKLGLEYYSSDNSSYYPNRSWSAILWKNYLTDDYLYRCDVAPEVNEGGNTLFSTYGYTGVFYATESFFATYALPDHRLKQASIKLPATKVVFTENWDSTAVYSKLSYSRKVLNDLKCRNVHGYSSNFVFADSHIDFLEIPVDSPFDQTRFYPDKLWYYPKNDIRWW